MVLHSVSLFPHGTMILEVDNPVQPLPLKTSELHHACKELATVTMSSNIPDCILLVTPHGIGLKDRFGIYGNVNSQGSAEWNGNWSSFSVLTEGDNTIASDLHNFLSSREVPIELLTCFSSGSAAPLAWAEVVPLWFLIESWKYHQNRPKVVVISQPTMRHTNPTVFSNLALLFGENLSDYMMASSLQIALVASADLSHVHLPPPNTHPLYLSPDPSLIPNAEIAKCFDQLIMKWASCLFDESDVKKASNVLLQALEIVSEAKTCGIGGICIIQGCAQHLITLQQRVSWNGNVYYYAAPTYYGMLVAGATITSR